jgi:NAD-dependent deacetylase
MVDPSRHLEQLAGAISNCRSLTVVTGAGISAASGIATFRSGPNALWSRETMEKATLRFFRQRPLDSWRWYAERLDALQSASPNPGHLALAELGALLARQGRTLRLITQNIDGLHRQAAPAQDLIEVHGCARFARCVDPSCCATHDGGLLAVTDLQLQARLGAGERSALPQCEHCGSLLRPHVLWFDEYYDSHPAYRFDELQHWAALSDLFLFVGTSFAVGVTDYLLREHVLGRYVAGYSIDANGEDAGGLLTSITGTAETLLPQLQRRCAALFEAG